MKRARVLVLAAALAVAACHAPPEHRSVQPPVVEGETVRFPANSPQLALLHSQQLTSESTETLKLPARIVWNETRTVRIVAPLAGKIGRAHV